MPAYAHIYLTGDTHGDFRELCRTLTAMHVTADDLVIILGDAGLNIDNGEHDLAARRLLNTVPCTFFCVHGNHERRPTSPGIRWKYRPFIWCFGIAYMELEYPRFIFAKDGEHYRINNREFLVIGGAHSIDRRIRAARGLPWFRDEQLNRFEQKAVLRSVRDHQLREDIILAHTCPYRFRPFTKVPPGCEPDWSMEVLLQKVLDMIEDRYTSFWCGHWHLEQTSGKVHFLYHNVIELPPKTEPGLE